MNSDELLNYRARIITMYQRYCPEKPLSHVDFLLAKYKGYESELIDVLREKYGPEPVLAQANNTSYQSQLASVVQGDKSPAQLEAMLQPFKGMEEALLYQCTNETSVVQGWGGKEQGGVGAAERSFLSVDWTADRNELFRKRQEQFRKDMAEIAKNKQQTTASAVLDSIAAAQEVVHKQEREIASLRSDFQALTAQHESTSMVLSEEIRSAAKELTRASLRLLQLQGATSPAHAPVQQLVDTEAQSEIVQDQLQQELKMLHALERVVRTHLALYPITPVRSQLRDMNAALCARLDTL